MVKIWNQLICSSTNDWKKKIWWIHTIELSCSRKKKSKIQPCNKSMQLEICTLSETASVLRRQDSYFPDLWYLLYREVRGNNISKDNILKFDYNLLYNLLFTCMRNNGISTYYLLISFSGELSLWLSNKLKVWHCKN